MENYLRSIHKKFWWTKLHSTLTCNSPWLLDQEKDIICSSLEQIIKPWPRDLGWYFDKLIIKQIPCQIFNIIDQSLNSIWIISKKPKDLFLFLMYEFIHYYFIFKNLVLGFVIKIVILLFHLINYYFNGWVMLIQRLLNYFYLLLQNFVHYYCLFHQLFTCFVYLYYNRFI